VIAAVERVGESITFSAATVVAALLSLLFATFEFYSNLGIPLAIGIVVMLLAGLTLTHVIREWHLIVIAFLVGIVNAFDVPIRQAFFVHMVGKEDLPNAIALNSSIFNGARVIGPAIAGFTIVLVGEGWCFFLNGVSFIAVLVALLMIQDDTVLDEASPKAPL